MIRVPLFILKTLDVFLRRHILASRFIFLQPSKLYQSQSKNNIKISQFKKQGFYSPWQLSIENRYNSLLFKFVKKIDTNICYKS